MQLKTRTQVWAGFAVGFAGMAAVTAAGALGTRLLASKVEELTAQHIVVFEALSTVSESQAAVMRSLATLAVPQASEGAARAELFEGLKAAFIRLEKAKWMWESTPHEDLTQALWDELQLPLAAFMQKAREVEGFLKQRDRAEAQGKKKGDAGWDSMDEQVWTSWRNVDSGAKEVEEKLRPLVEQARKNVAGAQAEAVAAQRRALLTLGAALLLGGVALAGLGALIGHRVERSLRALAGEAGWLAAAVREGELDVRGEEMLLAPEFRPRASCAG